jgi:hypothetical protein
MNFKLRLTLNWVRYRRESFARPLYGGAQSTARAGSTSTVPNASRTFSTSIVAFRCLQILIGPILSATEVSPPVGRCTREPSLVLLSVSRSHY